MEDFSESVGDSSRDVVASVQCAAKSLLKTVLQCRAGASGSTGNHQEDTVASLLRRKQQLRLEYTSTAAELELRDNVAAHSLQTDDVNSSPEQLCKRIAEARDRLAEVRGKYLLDQSLLQCLQTGECLLKKLFPKYRTPEDKELAVMVDKQTELVGKILRDCDDLTLLNGNIASVQKDRVISQQNCRALHTTISKLQETQQTHQSSDDGIEADLQRMRSEVSLLRGSLRCVIAGSGVDWTEDDNLLRIMTETSSVR